MSTKVQISLPLAFSRLYPAWTLEDHQFFAEAYKQSGNQLDAFKALLDSKEITYAHIVE